MFKIHEEKVLSQFKFYYMSAAIFIPCIIIFPFEMINLMQFKKFYAKAFITLPLNFAFLLNLVDSILSMLVLVFAFKLREQYKISIAWFKKLTHVVGIVLIATFFLEISFIIFSYHILSEKIWMSSWQIILLTETHIKNHAMQFIPLCCLGIVIGLFNIKIKKMSFDETTETKHTSGNFGSSSSADQKELEKIKAYSEKNGPFIGVDYSGRSLYLPMHNKLTISPPGGGKTTSSTIPILLTHSGPVFVFDVKGELWATTARYRLENLKRDIVVIDPFGVTRSDDFKRNKPQQLLKEYHLNPFDWIPEDQKERDRMINSFASSFVVNEGGHATHFDENAKILIRGYIDYMMNIDKSLRNLPTLYQLMSENIEQAQLTFNQMAQFEGRSGAAANQINRVGQDERGSILSTSYRQIDWMGDSNIQQTLRISNFDLRDFLKGNMDIFVVLPEDQVKEHSRLFRMISSLLMSMIVKANPSELPKQKMLFLLEELAQLGASPDVEQCIEVMRIRGVIVWTVFQALKQIEMFSKPDLFLSVPLKQIFTNDDVHTMQWIQTLGGKKTVLTKTLSTNKGDSHQKMQVFGGSISSGEGESIQETGADLIQLNEIRELPQDEQLIFLHGAKPIRCKKVRYFEHPDFLGKYDSNPLEKSF